MWNEPNNSRLSRIPKLYETEHTPLEDKVVYLHFFFCGCDWYVSEYDGVDTFFGYAILNGAYEFAEWGFISFSELRGISIGGIEVDCECEGFWKPRPAYQIEKIRRGMRLELRKKGTMQ